MTKEVKAKRDGVINTQIYSFNQFLNMGSLDALKMLRINQS